MSAKKSTHSLNNQNIFSFSFVKEYNDNEDFQEIPFASGVIALMKLVHQHKSQINFQGSTFRVHKIHQDLILRIAKIWKFLAGRDISIKFDSLANEYICDFSLFLDSIDSFISNSTPVLRLITTIKENKQIKSHSQRLI